MVRRVYFLVVTLFWVIMNVLLWRSEFAGEPEAGSQVPLELVWQRILTAPDDSALEITRAGQKIGYCRWRANVTEAVAVPEETEGQVKHRTGYTLDLEGNLTAEAGHVRFNLHADFGPNHVWKDLTLRASARPTVWEVRAVAASNSLTLAMEDGAEKWQHSCALSDLRDPAKLLSELGVPVPPVLLLALPKGTALTNPSPQSVGLKWSARQDWLRIGHSRVRVYRLASSLFDRYRAAVLVSRVGELLRVELPGEILLVNEALTTL